ncbi:hypothetical protein BKA81DRAFT_347241 [Phyllosticta paracitricarpa]
MPCTGGVHLTAPEDGGFELNERTGYACTLVPPPPFRRRHTQAVTQKTHSDVARKNIIIWFLPTLNSSSSPSSSALRTGSEGGGSRLLPIHACSRATHACNSSIHRITRTHRSSGALMNSFPSFVHLSDKHQRLHCAPSKPASKTIGRKRRDQCHVLPCSEWPPCHLLACLSDQRADAPQPPPPCHPIATITIAR